MDQETITKIMADNFISKSGRDDAINFVRDLIAAKIDYLEKVNLEATTSINNLKIADECILYLLD